MNFHAIAQRDRAAKIEHGDVLAAAAAAAAATARRPTGARPSAVDGSAARPSAETLQHVVLALKGFFRSISLGRGREHSLQDLLWLLTLWFRYGGEAGVEAALLEGFDAVDIDMWLLVIPQIIARINASNISVRKSVHALLRRVGRQHPQALIYPLAVASHEARAPPPPRTRRRRRAGGGPRASCSRCARTATRSSSRRSSCRTS